MEREHSSAIKAMSMYVNEDDMDTINSCKILGDGTVTAGKKQFYCRFIKAVAGEEIQFDCLVSKPIAHP